MKEIVKDLSTNIIKLGGKPDLKNNDQQNLIKELNNYRWLEKKSQTPISDFDHCIDAIRYSVAYQLANPYAGQYHII